MFYSLYPTDSAAVRQEVVAAASDGGELFTSLHIPEAQQLHDFVDFCAHLHRKRGLRFCADISPATLTTLGLELCDIGSLAAAGVSTLRIDYGFTVAQIVAIAKAGSFRVAINASTATSGQLDELAGIPVVGWHNYYPRPETGITAEFFGVQNELFLARGLEVYCFIPGERALRAPLHMGLPTLEEQRWRNSYVNYLQLKRLAPKVRIGCAEGSVHPQHVEWISHWEATGEVTLPVVGLDVAARFLTAGSWRLRADCGPLALRIEDTRRGQVPAQVVNGEKRTRGSLQMDLPTSGRYCGEVQLMAADAPLTQWQACVGAVDERYQGALAALRPGDTVRFVYEVSR